MTSTFLEKITSGSVANADKFKLIAQEVPKFSPTDVTQVLGELFKSRSYAKYTTNIINLTKNFDDVTQHLLNGDGVICASILRFPWIYTRENAANEKFLRDFLPKISYTSKMKLTYQLGRWVEDETLGDDLWQVLRESSSRIANRMLAGCSNQLILREMGNGKAILQDAQMLIILKKRYDTGVQLLKTILEKKSLNRVNYKNSLLWILKRDFMTGFDLSVEHNQNISFGLKRTRTILQRSDISADCNTALHDQVLKYSKNLNRSALQRRAKDDLYLQIFINITLADFSAHFPQSILDWLNHLTVSDKLRYLKTLYQEKYGKDFSEVPQSVFPEMLYLLQEEEWLKIVEWKIENLDLSYARENMTNDLFWTSMKPPKIGIEELRKLVFSEGDSDNRGELYNLMLMSAIYAHDQLSLVEAMKFVVKRSRNELQPVRLSLFSRLLAFYHKEKYVLDEMWPHVKELMEVSILKADMTSHSSGSDILDLAFAVIKAMNVTSSIDLDEVIDVIMKAHFAADYSPYSYFHYLQMVKSAAVQQTVIEKMLQKQEAHFEKSGSQKVWSILYTIGEGKYRLDMSPYPKCLELCMSLLSPEGKAEKHWVNEKDRIQIAIRVVYTYSLGPDVLTKDEALAIHRRACPPEKSVSLRGIRKKLIARESLLDYEMGLLTKNTNSHQFALLYLLHSTVALNDTVSAVVVENCIRLIDEAKDHEKTAANLLAIFLEPEDFRERFQCYYPTETKIKAAEVDLRFFKRQKAICYAIRLLKNRNIGLEMLSHFLHGDYLKYAHGSLNVICAHSPTNVVLPYLESRLVNCPVSAQKHMIRWFFQLAPNNTVNRYLEVLGNTTNSTIKLIILKRLYLEISDNGADMWTTLNKSLKSILPKNRQLLTYIMQTQSIDNSLGSNTSSFFRQLLTMADLYPFKYTSETHAVYWRAGRLLDILDVDLNSQMFSEACSLPLEYYTITDYVVNFPLHSDNEGRMNLFLSKFFALTLGSNEEVHKRIHVIAKGVCLQVITRKCYFGKTLHIELLQKMMSTLSSKIEVFLPVVVRIELTLAFIALELSNLNRREEQGKQRSAHLTAFAVSALNIVVDWLKKFGLELLPLLSQLLKSVIVENSGVCKCPMIKLVAAVKPGEDRIKDLIVIQNLPPYSLVSDSDEDQCMLSSFIDGILQGSDLTCKIILNKKLE